MKAILKTLAIRALVRIYPLGWRREYGVEMEALLAAEKFRVSTPADVVFNGVRQRLRCGKPELLVGAGLLLWALFWTAWNSLAPLSPRCYSLFNLAQYCLFFSAYFATAYWITSRTPRPVWRGVLASVVVALIGIAPELLLVALHACGLLPLANIGTNGVQQGRGISLLYTRGSVKPRYIDFELVLFPAVACLVAATLGLLGALAGRLTFRLAGDRI